MGDQLTSDLRWAMAMIDALESAKAQENAELYARVDAALRATEAQKGTEPDPKD